MRASPTAGSTAMEKYRYIGTLLAAVHHNNNILYNKLHCKNHWECTSAGSHRARDSIKLDFRLMDQIGSLVHEISHSESSGNHQ